MPFSDATTPEQLQATINSLLETARRCRRLCAKITDNETCRRLLELANDCEEKAEELRQRGFR